MNFDFLNMFAIASYITIAGIATYLIFAPEYEDGLIGRIALSTMAVGSIIRLMQIHSSTTYMPAGITVLGGVAIFLIRHAWHYHVAVSKNEPSRFILPRHIKK